MLFWSDEWKIGDDSTPLRTRFARLFSFAINDKVSVEDVCNTEDRSDLFHLPLSAQAYEEYTSILI